MPQLIGGLLAIALAIYVVWTVAVAALKVASFLIYLVPVVIAILLVAGVVFALVTAVWVLLGGGTVAPLIRTPQQVAAGKVFRRAPTGPSKAYGWDRAWPSYIPYQIVEDVKAIYATQANMLKGYWQSALTLIEDRGAVLQIIGTVLSAGLLGSFGAATLVTTTFFVVVLGIPFGGLMLLRWASIYALRGFDVGYRLTARSSAKCPYCYEPTTLPSFECPDASCAHVHRDVRPGRLGVVRRQCACGAGMPTMVVRASLARLKARCPSCDEPLTVGAGSRRTIQVPVFGTTMSGKTRFMLGATVALEQRLTAEGGVLRGTTPASQSQLENARTLIGQRTNTPKTDAKLPTAFGLIADPAEGREVELHLYDAAGELFDTWDSSANLRYLQSAEGLVFVVDPLTTSAARAALTRLSGPVQVSIGSGNPTDSYDNAVEYLRAANSNLKQKSLAVVLTKADVLLQLPVAGDMRASDEESIRDWLMEHDLDSLLERTRLDFGAVKYFAVDSMHSIDPSSPLSPYHPLNWLLRQSKIGLTSAESAQTAVAGDDRTTNRS